MHFILTNNKQSIPNKWCRYKLLTPLLGNGEQNILIKAITYNIVLQGTAVPTRIFPVTGEIVLSWNYLTTVICIARISFTLKQPPHCLGPI